MSKLFFLSLILGLLSCYAPKEQVPRGTVPIEVHFSPGEGCEGPMIRHIDAAQGSIRVQAYGFTSTAISEALIRAKTRGVDVQVIVDRSELNQKSELASLRHGGLHPRIDSAHAIAHNKVMIFDEETVETGSYNYTESAEHRNAENCVFIKDFALARSFSENWRNHYAHSLAAR